MKRPLVLLVALVGLLNLGVLGGCSDECRELADLACAKAGEQSEECKKIRARAEASTPDDKRMCKKALAVTEQFTANN